MRNRPGGEGRRSTSRCCRLPRCAAPPALRDTHACVQAIMRWQVPAWRPELSAASLAAFTFSKHAPTAPGPPLYMHPLLRTPMTLARRPTPGAMVPTSHSPIAAGSRCRALSPSSHNPPPPHTHNYSHAIDITPSLPPKSFYRRTTSNRHLLGTFPPPQQRPILRAPTHRTRPSFGANGCGTRPMQCPMRCRSLVDRSLVPRLASATSRSVG